MVIGLLEIGFPAAAFATGNPFPVSVFVPIAAKAAKTAKLVAANVATFLQQKASLRHYQSIIIFINLSIKLDCL